MEVKLVLLLLGLIMTIDYVRGQCPKVKDECCYKRTLEGVSYTFVESGSSEVASYGCDTPGSCVYKNEETGERYCFKRGGKEEPVCELKPCDDQVDLIITEGLNLQPQSFPIDNCKPPTLPPIQLVEKFYKCSNKLFVQKSKTQNTERIAELWVQKNSTTWTLVENPADMKPPYKSQDLAIAVENDKLYLVGGYNKATKQGVTDVWVLDCVKLAQGENANGAAWQKHTQALAETNYGAKVCLSGGYLAVIQGLKGTTTTKGLDEKIRIYDLSKTNGGPVTEKDFTDNVHELVCDNLKLYYSTKGDLKMKKINMDTGTLETVPDSKNTAFQLLFLNGQLSQIRGSYDGVLNPNIETLADNGTWIEGKCISLGMNQFKGVARLPFH